MKLGDRFHDQSQDRKNGLVSFLVNNRARSYQTSVLGAIHLSYRSPNLV